MQTYALNLAGQPSRIFNTVADLFVYESGTNGEEGEVRIIVKPDNGSEMTLRPGQRFRLPPGEKAQQWMVRAYDNEAPIAGAIIIGSGEFDDANTINKFTLDASLANNVTVKNGPDARVPVSLNPQDIINLADPIMSYTDFKRVAVPAQAQTTVITAAENTNGVIIEQIYASGGGTAGFEFAVPGNPYYETLEIVDSTMKLSRRRTKVRAGVAVMAYSNTAGTVFINFTNLAKV